MKEQHMFRKKINEGTEILLKFDLLKISLLYEITVEKEKIHDVLFEQYDVSDALEWVVREGVELFSRDVSLSLIEAILEYRKVFARGLPEFILDEKVYTTPIFQRIDGRLLAHVPNKGEKIYVVNNKINVIIADGLTNIMTLVSELKDIFEFSIIYASVWDDLQERYVNISRPFRVGKAVYYKFTTPNTYLVREYKDHKLVSATIQYGWSIRHATIVNIDGDIISKAGYTAASDVKVADCVSDWMRWYLWERNL